MNEIINLKGYKFKNWNIDNVNGKYQLLIGMLLVSEHDSIQQAMQNILDIENESDWCDVDDWVKKHREVVLVCASSITTFGILKNIDKAYWNEKLNSWSSFGIKSGFTNSYTVSHVMKFPELPHVSTKNKCK